MADLDEPEVAVIPGRKRKTVRGMRSEEEDFVKSITFFHQFLALVSVKNKKLYER